MLLATELHNLHAVRIVKNFGRYPALFGKKQQKLAKPLQMTSTSQQTPIRLFNGFLPTKSKSELKMILSRPRAIPFSELHTQKMSS